MRASRVLLATGLVAAGICAAWPFRQPLSGQARPPAAAATVPLALPLRRPDITLEATKPSGQSPASELEMKASLVRRSSLKTSLASLDDLTPPPDLPISFQPRQAPLEAVDLQAQTPRTARPGVETDPAYRPRTYRLRDGDTLEALAERFLGSRERAGEIFAANQPALSRPDLLPVGTSITIPPRLQLDVVEERGKGL